MHKDKITDAKKKSLNEINLNICIENQSLRKCQSGEKDCINVVSLFF